MKDYKPSMRTSRYFYAIPLQGTLGKKAKDRGVAFRFPIETEQAMAENFMMDMGYNNHQYYFQTDSMYHTPGSHDNLVINQVRIKHKNATWYYTIVS
jgi:hypothetical protein